MPEYPPTRTVVLGEARDRLQAAAEPTDADLPERPRSPVGLLADGTAWAAAEWGDDAEVVLRAMTAGERAEMQDYLARNWVGEAGPALVDLAQLAACLEAAPFIDDGDGLKQCLEAVDGLPPAFVDFLLTECDQLHALDAGN